MGAFEEQCESMELQLLLGHGVPSPHVVYVETIAAKYVGNRENSLRLTTLLILCLD